MRCEGHNRLHSKSYMRGAPFDAGRGLRGAVGESGARLFAAVHEAVRHVQAVLALAARGARDAVLQAPSQPSQDRTHRACR